MLGLGVSVIAVFAYICAFSGYFLKSDVTFKDDCEEIIEDLERVSVCALSGP